MGLQWIHETAPIWDESKSTVLAGAPDGIFKTDSYRPGSLIPGDWWRVEDDGKVVGYGWMDCTWGEAEILLVVDPGSQERGVGTFIMDHLESEARERGVNYMYNVVPAAHPDGERVTAWLRKRRFEAAESDRLRRLVRGEAKG